MRLMYVLEYYYPNIGGVETLFKNLIESLAREGHQITVITSRITRDLPLHEKSGNIQIVRMPFNNRYLFTFLGFFYLLPYIRKVDLVHTTSYNAAIPAFFGGKLFGKQVIITFHEVWGNLWFRLPYMGRIAKYAHYLFEQALLKLPFNHFVGVSDSTSQNLIESSVSSNKVSTIYNGINYDDFKLPQPVMPSSEKKKFTFTYFGRLGISKGWNLLLEAFPQVFQEYPDIELKMIIPEEPPSFLKIINDYIQNNELENSIHLMHHLSFENLKREIAKADCILIPSYSEGFCFAAVETIALGVPLISSDQTALREVVSGKFIKMKTLSVDALVKAMKKALDDQWEISPVREFHLADTIVRYKGLYGVVLGARGQGRGVRGQGRGVRGEEPGGEKLKMKI